MTAKPHVRRLVCYLFGFPTLLTQKPVPRVWYIDVCAKSAGILFFTPSRRIIDQTLCAAASFWFSSRCRGRFPDFEGSRVRLRLWQDSHAVKILNSKCV